MFDIQHNHFSSRVERWMSEGSRWTIDSMLQHHLVISEFTPCKESFYFPIPKEVRSLIKGFIYLKGR